MQTGSSTYCVWEIKNELKKIMRWRIRRNKGRSKISTHGHSWEQGLLTACHQLDLKAKLQCCFSLECCSQHHVSYNWCLCVYIARALNLSKSHGLTILLISLFVTQNSNDHDHVSSISLPEKGQCLSFLFLPCISSPRLGSTGNFSSRLQSHMVRFPYQANRWREGYPTRSRPIFRSHFSWGHQLITIIGNLDK